MMDFGQRDMSGGSLFYFSKKQGSNVGNAR